MVLFLVVGGLLAFAVYRSDIFAPKGKVQEGGGGDIDPDELGQTAEDTGFGERSRRSRNTHSSRPSGCRR